MSRFEWREPFGLKADEVDIPSDKRFEIHCRVEGTMATPLLEATYVFEEGPKNLLIDIDNDNVAGVEHALTTQKIDVNRLYAIPNWEVPEAIEPQYETFLHRALWHKSADVFKFLLQNGADPRIEDHCNRTVIQNLFGGEVPRKDILMYGKMLVDTGVKAGEIRSAVGSWNKRYRPYARKLALYAAKRKIKQAHKKVAKIVSTLGARVRE